MSAVGTEVSLPEAALAPSEPGRSTRWLTARGRCGVLAYNGRFTLIILVVALAALGGALLAGSNGAGGRGAEPGGTAMTAVAVALAIGVLAMLPIAFCAFVQRLHDLGLSGWFVLLSLVPVVGTLFGLYVALVPGRRDANRFGGWRAATGVEKAFGVVGLAIVALGLAGLVATAMSGGLASL